MAEERVTREVRWLPRRRILKPWPRGGRGGCVHGALQRRRAIVDVCDPTADWDKSRGTGLTDGPGDAASCTDRPAGCCLAHGIGGKNAIGRCSKIGGAAIDRRERAIDQVRAGRELRYHVRHDRQTARERADGRGLAVQGDGRHRRGSVCRAARRNCGIRHPELQIADRGLDARVDRRLGGDPIRQRLGQKELARYLVEQRASEDGEKHQNDQEGAEYAALLTSSLEVAPSPPQHGNVTYTGAWATMRG